jgi:hypothetical protein
MFARDMADALADCALMMHFNTTKQFDDAGQVARALAFLEEQENEYIDR